MQDLGSTGLMPVFATASITIIITAIMVRAIQPRHAGHPAAAHPFHILLRTEQLGVRAIRGYEPIVRALLRDGPPIEHDHMVRVGRVRHAVRDHQHGFPIIGERANRP